MDFRYNLLIVCAFLVVAGCKSFGNPKSVDGNAGFDIVWDQSTLKQIAPPPAGTSGHVYSYPRMVAQTNGTLLCAFEHNGSIELAESRDGGSTWNSPKVIVDKRDNINIANPELSQLDNGTILLAYNLRPRRLADGTYDPEKKFSICIKRSPDNGNTWLPEQLLYEAGSDFKNGCWEPSIVQLPSGELQLFFANEAVYTTSEEQDISMLQSNDNGLSWTTEPQIVCFAKGFRDGMPVPVYDKSKNEVLLAIEDNSKGGEFNPSVIRLKQSQKRDFVAINSPDRIRLLQNEISKDVYAGAPYIRMLKNGITILSFQSTLHRDRDWRLSTMDVAVGADLDKLRLTTQPFNIPRNKSALWNSLCVTNDNSIIALTSTNAFNNYTAIWMIRGKVKTN